jgi:hypothetical protein
MPRTRQLGGFWEDLFGTGQKWIEERTSEDRDSHIPYQESAQSQIVDAFARYSRGWDTGGSAVDAINRARDYFLDIARRIGTPRAQAGARDVTALASDTISRITSGDGGGPRAIFRGGVGGVDLTTVALLGVGFFALRALTKRAPR